MAHDLETYFNELRLKGLLYYNEHEILSAYERFISSLEKDGYDGVVAELQFDMEIWYLLDEIRSIILKNSSYSDKEKPFLDEFEKLDKKFLAITLPVKNVPNLPWWYYRVLKKAGIVYAEDVKGLFGVDIELVK